MQLVVLLVAALMGLYLSIHEAHLAAITRHFALGWRIRVNWVVVSRVVLSSQLGARFSHLLHQLVSLFLQVQFSLLDVSDWQLVQISWLRKFSQVVCDVVCMFIGVQRSLQIESEGFRICKNNLFRRVVRIEHFGHQWRSFEACLLNDI